MRLPVSNRTGMRRSWVLLVGPMLLALVTLSPGATATSAKAELRRTGFMNAGEPNIGIAADGTIYSTVMGKVVRSTDRGRKWTDVTPPGHVATLDPFLYVDKGTGRVF